MKTAIKYQQVVHTILLLATLLLSACTAPMPAATSGGAAPAAGHSEQSTADSAASSAESGAVAPNDTDPWVTVTAGVTDDNVEWQAYLDYLARNEHIYANQRDVSERYRIQVTDEAARPVHDATVEIYMGDKLFFSGRTDAGGQLFFHPLALDNHRYAQQTDEYRVVASKGFVASSQIFTRDQPDQWHITLADPVRSPTTQLDLLFLIDATGSMDDEIDKLKDSMADIADQIATLPEAPDVRYGLVAYRDRGDAFVVRSYDFTPDLRAFQRTLAALRADGGGDEPEALNEALHRSLHELSWRAEDTVRLVILVADAPPHLDYGWEDFSYDRDMIEAVRLGIKIFPVGASNLNTEGEYIFRQLAQFTGGKFVFLTYANGSDPSSGPGTETDHDVDVYSVDTLDRLVVRLVREELTKLSSVSSANQPVASQPSPIPTPTPQPRQPVACTIDLRADWHDCEGISAIQFWEQGSDSVVLQLTLNAQTTGYTRARFDIAYAADPTGWNVQIREAANTEQRASQPAAEVSLLDNSLSVYGNGDLPEREQLTHKHQLFALPAVVRRGETLSLEVAQSRLGINYGGGIEVVDSPYIFGTNPILDVAFNRSLDGMRSGSGISQVVVTLYPAR